MKYTVTLILVSFFIVQACSESISDPSKIYLGITETGPAGPEPIGNIDHDDWLEQFDYSVVDGTIPLSYSVSPAYPNPTTRYCNLRFAVPMSDSVVIILDDRALDKTTTILSERLNPGTYNILIDLNYGDDFLIRDESIVRLYFYIPTISVFPEVHGDIKIIK